MPDGHVTLEQFERWDNALCSFISATPAQLHLSAQCHGLEHSQCYVKEENIFDFRFIRYFKRMKIAIIMHDIDLPIIINQVHPPACMSFQL